MLWNSSRLVSLAVGGVVTELLDVRIVYIVAGLLLFGAAAVGLTAQLEPVSKELTERRATGDARTPAVWRGDSLCC